MLNSTGNQETNKTHEPHDTEKPFWKGFNGIVAHRFGAGSNVHLENSLVALKDTGKKGYKFYESDFRATRDGKIYARHGTTKELWLDNFRYLDIEKLHSADIRSIRSGGSVVMAELSEILEELKRIDGRLFTEIKHSKVVEPLAKEIVRLKAIGRVSIISFVEPWTHGTANEIYKQTGERVSTSMLVGTKPGATVLKARLAVGGHRAAPYDAVLMNHKLATPGFVEDIHDADMKALAWTVNEEVDARRVFDAGADGLETNFTDRLNPVVQEYIHNDQKHSA